MPRSDVLDATRADRGRRPAGLRLHGRRPRGRWRGTSRGGAGASTARTCSRSCRGPPTATARWASPGPAGASLRHRGRASRGRWSPRTCRARPGSASARRTGAFALGDIGVGPLSGVDVLLAAYPISGRGEAAPSVLFAAIDLRRLAREPALNNAPREHHLRGARRPRHRGGARAPGRGPDRPPPAGAARSSRPCCASGRARPR